MTRIDLEQIAAEFGLVVEKSDVGTYKQWKNAQIDLFFGGLDILLIWLCK